MIFKITYVVILPVVQKSYLNNIPCVMKRVLVPFKHNKIMLFFTTLILIYTKDCISVSLDSFFPFGNSSGDSILSKEDDGFDSFELDELFVFYNRSHSKVFVSFCHAF